MTEIQNSKKDQSNMRNILLNCESIMNAVDEKCSKVQTLTIFPNLIDFVMRAVLNYKKISKTPSLRILKLS